MLTKIETSCLVACREPHKGELTYELKRILLKHCSTANIRGSIDSVRLAVSRLAKRFNVHEFECTYNRSCTIINGERSFDENIEIVAFRRQSNGTLSIYRAGASAYPVFYKVGNVEYLHKSDKQLSVYYGVDEFYTWGKHYKRKNIPARILARKR